MGLSIADDRDGRLYNSRIVDNYIRLLEKKYAGIDPEMLLRHAGMSMFQVRDEGHWFSQEQIDRFHEKLTQLTGNETIAREAGAFSASAEALGCMRRYILSFITPIKVLEMLGNWAQRFTRSSRYESEKIGINTLAITVTPNPGVREKPFQCENRMGYLEGVTKLFAKEPPRIEHDKCLFRGDGYCRYIVTFPEPRSIIMQRICSSLFLAMPLAGIGLFLSPFSRMTSLVMFSLMLNLVFLLGLYSKLLASRELRETVSRARDSADELIEQINVNYNNALLMNETAIALYCQSDVEGILQKVTCVLRKRLDYSRALILLANSEEKKLLPSAGYGYSDEERELIAQWAGIRLDNNTSSGIFLRAFREQRPFLVNDFRKIEEEHSERSRDFARRLGVRSFICCPLVFEKKSLGILAVDNLKTGRPLLERDMNLLMGVARQIGVALHNVQLENQLRQVQKNEAIGALSRGIAHDFNNILTGILSFADIAGYEAKCGRPIDESLEKIKTAGNRAKELVRQILTFSCTLDQERKPLDLGALINEALTLLKARIPDNIAIRLEIAENCRSVSGDETQLYQVIVNLCLNAIQAMEPGGGVLRAGLDNIYVSEEAAATDPNLMAGDYVRLLITDSGKGMSPETMARIFDPYFTTKKKGEGSGIGLSVALGIVKKHGGTITVDSAPGAGARFRVLLPGITIQKEYDKKSISPLKRGTGTVLVVDDEEFLCDILQDMLRELGYQAEKFTDCQEALASFRKCPGYYDLVITDYTQPKMDGVTLARELRALKPETPVILCTGLGDHLSRQISKEAGLNGYLCKPIILKQLASVVHAVLHNREEQGSHLF